MNSITIQTISQRRRRIALFTLFVAMAALPVQAVHLPHYKRDFRQHEGAIRYQRLMPILASRGVITDRNGEVLAVSSPVNTVWADPRKTKIDDQQLSELANLLETDKRRLSDRILARPDRAFVYLKRHIEPQIGKRVKDLAIPGVHLRHEYHRYYPWSEVSSHVLGFTDIDDRGQEGIELAYNDWLGGLQGEKSVIKDRKGRVVKDLPRYRAPNPGKNVKLSLDIRIQYQAYKELMSAVKKEGARSGSIVVLDPHNGEVMAMVNYPHFNPNNRASLHSQRIRNRAVTDLFEPGSTVKPFAVAAAIENGLFSPETMIDTSPGWYMVRGHTIQDEHNYGKIDLSRVIIKSSNVGAAKIALAMSAQELWNVYRRVGFGEHPGSGFPGEVGGLLSDYHGWNKIERATLAFGYGLSVTPLQLAQAYSILANGGLKTTATFLTTDNPKAGPRVMSAKTCRKIREMLEGVVSAEGTAKRAGIKGYRVAGKTGTVHKSTKNGYAKDRYVSVFAGMAPASNPRLVTVVMLDEPSKGQYFGGVVAAPVFAKVMAEALRLLGVPPDDLPTLQANTAARAGSA